MRASASRAARSRAASAACLGREARALGLGRARDRLLFGGRQRGAAALDLRRRGRGLRGGLLGREAQAFFRTGARESGGGLALRLVAQRGQRLHLAREPRDIRDARLDRRAVRAHLLVERLRLGAHPREVGAGGGELGRQRAGLAFGRGAALFGLGQATARLGQVARDARGIAAGGLRARQGLAQLAFERGNAFLGPTPGQADIRQARRQPVTLSARAVTLRRQPVPFLAQRRQRTLRRITCRRRGRQLLGRARQAGPQFLRLATLERQHLRQLRHLAVQPIERAIPRRHRNREEPLRQREHQQHENDDHE